MKIILLFAFFCSAVHAEEIVVFAASSLTDTLSQISKSYEKEHQTTLKLSFDSSSRLAFQLEQGAKADLFFSADKEFNSALIKKGLTTEQLTSDLLSNELVVITHLKHQFALAELSSLKNLKFKHIALAQENVPAGKFAREALRKAGVYENLKSKIVSGDHVRNVLGWVARDEADLAIVFATDAKSSPAVKVLYKIPTTDHSQIIYPLSVMGKNPRPAVMSFYRHLQTLEVKNVFIQAGFKSVGK